MTVGFVLLMRRYTSVCRFAASANLTLTFMICDVVLAINLFL